MTNLSTLVGGTTVTIHSGKATQTATLTGGTTPFVFYFDVTVSVTDYTKCIPFVAGSVDGETGPEASVLHAEMINNTTLRIGHSINNGTANVPYSYHIIEYS